MDTEASLNLQHMNHKPDAHFKLIPQTKGCVSFCLYGEEAKYAWGMLENIELAKQFYPGWRCRVYLDRGHYAKPALVRAGAEVIDMHPRPGSGGMFWRLLAADDPEFTHVIFRDADSRINSRDAACTEAWLASKKTLHAIHDHPDHLGKPVMGGMWGIVSGHISMLEEIEAWQHDYQYGDDEEFIWRKVWERFRSPEDYYIHSFSPNDHENPIHDHASYQGFVGERIPFSFLMPGIWEAYVISPPHYQERRKLFFERLKHHNGFLNVNNVKWHKGLTAEECPVPPEFHKHGEYPHYYLVTRDHLHILREGIKNNLDFLFVFEDDIQLRDDFDEHLARTMMCIPDDWLAIQLGGQGWTDNNRDWFYVNGKRTYPNALARTKGCLGMHATLWNKEGMRRAVEYFEAKGVQSIIDWDFAAWQKEEDRFYSAMRWIAEIDDTAAQYGGDK